MNMAALGLLFTIASQTQGLPIGLLSALCFIESTHHVEAFNANDKGSPSHGVCQVKFGTARAMGFTGTMDQLQDPTTNVRYASKYLRNQLRRYNNDTRKAVAAYNSGTYRIGVNGLPINQ